MVVLKKEIFEGDKNNVVFVIHGWTGAPATLRPLAQAINNKGATVHVPLLAGHGCDSPDDFVVPSFIDWIKQVENEIEAYKKLNPQAKISIVGHSMGGLIATAVSQKLGYIENVVLAAPAFTPKDWMIYLTPFLSLFVKYWKIDDKAARDYATKYPTDTVFDDLKIKVYMSYTFVEPAKDLLFVGDEARKAAKKLTGKNILFVYALDDEAVSNKVVDYIDKNISSKNKVAQVIQPNGGHEMYIRDNKQFFIDETLKFLFK